VTNDSQASPSQSPFDDPRYAPCYDAFFPWEERDDFHFYLPLIMAAPAVLDVGCGTGMLLHHARDAGHTGRLVGLDPAEGMLTRARRRTDVDWVRGDLRSVSYAGEFDLVVMTGHAFQELVTDEDLHAALTAIRAALADDGQFAFETRNPAVRGWEQWDSEYALSVPDPEGSGGIVRMGVQPGTVEVTGDIVRLTGTLTGPAWPGRVITTRDPLRFLDAAALASHLARAGLAITHQFGDFDHSPLTADSPEIITIAEADKG
jgi:SAM-dependent methyltransferase